MPARVVVVHDNPGFLGDLTSKLGAAGHHVAGYADPLEAWNALEAAEQTDVLVTRVEFSHGKSNGVSLALMAKIKRPAIRVLFTALPAHEKSCLGIGEFLPLPASVDETIEVVSRLLK